MENLILIMFGITFGLLILGLWIWSLIWVYKDAEARGKPGLLVALMVALVSWPTSLLIWIVFRPDGITPALK